MANYTLTIAAANIAPSSLSPGHVWIQISDGTTTTSYGYYPRPGFDYGFGDPGEVRVDYDKNRNPDWTQDIPVTKEQYEKIKEFAEKTKDNPPGYDLSGAAGGNCASFVQSATNAAGITKIPNILKSPFPWWLPKSDWYRDAYYEYYRRPEFNREFRGHWNDAKSWRMPRDPILLDLDGDGLETVGLSSNIYFDHDGDGVLTKTGWAGTDDALLVWDRNGNGAIDSGAELFGDFTPLPNGTLAPNGFAALAALDANGDGVIDANDPAFAELKLWKDSDQNGQSGVGELIALADAGILSLNLVHTPKNKELADGNQLSHDIGETLVIKNRFNESNRFVVEEIAFTDGTLWDAETIKSRSLLGESGDDEFRDDVLVGGARSSDTLESGSGTDTYRFRLGDGQDAVIDGAWTAGNTNTLRFKAGVAPSDMRLIREGGDSVLTIWGAGNRVTLRQYFDEDRCGTNGPYLIECIAFGDGKAQATIKSRRWQDGRCANEEWRVAA